MNAFAKKLMAGAAVAALVVSMGSTGRAQGKDIVETAVGAGQFKTLAAALQAARKGQTITARMSRPGNDWVLEDVKVVAQP